MPTPATTKRAWNRTPTPNAPAVLNSWLLMTGDPRPSACCALDPKGRTLLAARLMRLAQIGYQAQRVDPDAPPSTLFMPGEDDATIE